MHEDASVRRHSLRASDGAQEQSFRFEAPCGVAHAPQGDASYPPLPSVRRHTLPAVCDLQEQQFSFVAAHYMGGQSMSGGRRSQQACKPPLPPPSPRHAATAFGGRSPAFLRRSASAKAVCYEDSHSVPTLERCLSAEHAGAQASSDAFGACAAYFGMQLGAQCGPEGAGSTSGSDILGGGYLCNMDEPSTLDQLLMDPELMEHLGLPQDLM